jgi:hypothetical protein
MPAQAYEHPYREYGQSWEIASALWDGPRTLPEIVDHFHSYVRLLGFFNVTRRMARRHGTMAARIEAMLEALIARGWIVRQGARYALTALLSGSVGLLNDATDTLLDGLSSVLVYLGLRFDRERAANGVLLMLGTGGLTCYEAVRRLLVPVAPDVDAFTFVATLLSALVCWGLYLYQRFVGVRSGSLALITQSVDSRNHVIVAASVTAGLIASRLDFPLLDTLVGLAVAEPLTLTEAGRAHLARQMREGKRGHLRSTTRKD